MMKNEFEDLAGIEVSYDDYVNIIEPMYMATNLDKVDFIKTLNLKRFALKTKKQLINELRKLCQEQNSHLISFRDYDVDVRIEKIISELQNRFDGYAYIEKRMKYGCFYYDTLVINTERIYLA